MTDHLFKRADGVPLEIEVPFVCKEVCAFGCFSTYPIRRGFDFNSHGHLRVRDNQRSELPSLLQEWLYFGLLQEFLEESIEISDFVRNPSGNHQVLDTSPLLTHIASWLARNRHRISVAKDAYSSILVAAAECRYLEGACVPANCDALPIIFLSIHLLIDTLVIASTSITYDIDDDSRIQRYLLSNELEYAPPSSAVLLDHMVQNRWCIHQARWFCENFTYNVVYYLASFARITSEGHHSGCEDEDHCIADNVDFKIINADTSDIKLIIRNGGIPLVSFTQAPSGALQHEVIEANYSSTYVAISHVWKDGLGNPRGNALPRCQAEKLVQKIKEISPSHYSQQSRGIFKFWRGKAPDRPVNVWMDTLCIPVDDDDLRIKAINRMTPSYKRAQKVLVIDSSLSEDLGKKASTEVCADLLMSAWNGRSWTLQEGALAKELSFPVSVCSAAPFVMSSRAYCFVVDLFFLWTAFRHHTSSCLSPPSKASNAEIYIHRQLHKAHQLPSVGRWGEHLMATTLLLDEYSRHTHLRKRQFTEVWNALLGRTTTMVKDVHGIIANLLDFNAEEILALHQSQRMKALLCAQDILPTKLLFDCSPHNYVEDPLDRWLPDIPRGTRIVPTDDWMRVTKDGLLIESAHCLNRSIVIKHEPTSSRVGKYCLLLNDLDPIKVNCHSISSCPYPKSANHTTLLLLVPRWRSLLMSGLTVRGASFAVERTDPESFRVYYDEPVDLRMYNWGSRDSKTLSNSSSLRGELVSQARSISIDIGIQTAYKPLYRRKADAVNPYSKTRSFICMLALMAPLTGLSSILFCEGLFFRFNPIFSTASSIIVLCLCPLPVLLIISCYYFYVRWWEYKYRVWLQTYDELSRAKMKQQRRVANAPV